MPCLRCDPNRIFLPPNLDCAWRDCHKGTPVGVSPFGWPHVTCVNLQEIPTFACSLYGERWPAGTGGPALPDSLTPFLAVSIGSFCFGRPIALPPPLQRSFATRAKLTACRRLTKASTHKKKKKAVYSINNVFPVQARRHLKYSVGSKHSFLPLFRCKRVGNNPLGLFTPSPSSIRASMPPGHDRNSAFHTYLPTSHTVGFVRRERFYACILLRSTAPWHTYSYIQENKPATYARHHDTS